MDLHDIITRFDLVEDTFVLTGRTPAQESQVNDEATAKGYCYNCMHIASHCTCDK